MAAAFATVEDYEARAAVTLPDGSPRRRQVEQYLVDASALMRRHIPAGYEPDTDTTRAICIAVVRRVLANPGGRRQRSIGQYAETLGEDGGLYLTDDEKQQLGDDTDADPDADGAYSLTLTDGPGWVPDPCGSWQPLGWTRGAS